MPRQLMLGQGRRVLGLIAALAVVLGLAPGGAETASAVSTSVVISRVYGGGGNNSAPYTHDYVELFNRGTTTASIAGWSIQYASATGTGNFGANSGQLTELPAVSLEPGQYFLIQEGGGTTGSALPTPDHIDPTPIAMAAGSGKVALVNSTTTLGCNGGSAPCSSDALAKIVDLVGYGSANFYEGSRAAPAPSNSTDVSRNSSGCDDTDNNLSDFTAGAPAPRNSASALQPCDGPPPPATPTDPSGTGAANPSSVVAGDSTLLTVAVIPGTNPTSTGLAVTGDLESIGGLATQQFFDDGTNGDVTSGDNTFSFQATVAQDTSLGDKSLLISVSDAESRSGSSSIALAVVTSNPCEQPFTPIFQIQGNGSRAATTGDLTTEGVVVGDFDANGGLGGFYLQDPTGDNNAATSDGIFVYTGSTDTVSPGRLVRVTGFARERFNQTTINGSGSDTSAVPATNIVDCGEGPVPAAATVTMPFESATYPERFEGMRVSFSQPLTIAEYFEYGRYGEIVLAYPGEIEGLENLKRLYTPTSIVEPGAAANALTAEYARRRITLDDGLSIQNPETLRHPNGDAFSLSNRFRGGDVVQNVVGVLGFDFSKYRIQPTAPAQFTPDNVRPATPEDVGGSLRVAAFNTLNYFLTPDGIDEGPRDPDDPKDNVCGGNANLECRGADQSQPDEFGRQRAKLLQAIIGLDADALGLNELENTPNVEPLADIVAGLNDLLGANTYDYIRTGTIGTDAIKVGIIYKPAALTPVGNFAVLTSSVDPRFIDTRSRPSLAQTFEQPNGARFTMVVNHLKSKGSPCGTEDPDRRDGQGNCNITRTLAAQALVDWLAKDPTGSGDSDFVILGDLNSYAQEDPIDAIRAGRDDAPGTADDWTNLIAKHQGLFAYSYAFNGQLGYLDHALGSPSLTGQVTGAADWHINADEPEVLDYDTSFKPAAQEGLYEVNAFRTSDHDPLIVGLNLNAPPTVDAGGPYSVDEGTSGMLAAMGSDPDGDALSYAWDLDNNGSFETSDQSTTFDASAIDGPATRTVAVKVTDTAGHTATAATTINIVNVAPAADADAVTLQRNSSIAFDPLLNDTDVPGDVLSVVSFTQPGSGTVDYSKKNLNFRYTPKKGFKGVDTFTYTITDDDGAQATGTVTITVQ